MLALLLGGFINVVRSALQKRKVLQMDNPLDYIGTEDTCHSCGEVKLVVCLDDEELPLCFECATKDMPQERGPKDFMPLQTRAAELPRGADKSIQAASIPFCNHANDPYDSCPVCADDEPPLTQTIRRNDNAS